MQLIKIDNIAVKYGNVVALHGVTMDVFDGDFVGVIGPNGGGKTTLIKAILGLVDVADGEIVRCVNGLKIGYLPQVATIDKRFPMKVVDVVCSGVNVSPKRVRDKAMQLLDVTGVGDKANSVIGELSGGQMQRVLLCRALIQEPEVLILDEPTTYVDSNFEQNFYDLLHKLNDKVAIIMVSHDLGMITKHVKTIACVNKSFHYHKSNVIDTHQLRLYDCDLQLVSHGKVPHTVLCNHK